MNRQKRTIVLAAGLLAALLLAVYWYASPYWEIRRLGEAARSRDGERFNAHVDYDRLRSSLKGQLAARLHASVKESGGNNPVAGLGRAMGLVMVDQVVDSMVRPEFVMLALQQPVRVAPPETPPRPAEPAAEPSPAQPEPAESSQRWRFQREGPDRMVVYPETPQPVAGAKQPLALVFQRSGFAHWNLVELRLPAPAQGPG